MNTRKVDKIFEEVARNHGTTVDEVKKEIDFAIMIAKNSPDPKAREEWKKMKYAGEVPTTEEFVIYMSQKIKKSKKRG